MQSLEEGVGKHMEHLAQEAPVTHYAAEKANSTAALVLCAVLGPSCHCAIPHSVPSLFSAHTLLLTP